MIHHCSEVKRRQDITSSLPYDEAYFLTFTTLWALSADDKLMIFFLFFPVNRIWHFMQIVSWGDNLHEMSNPVFWEKQEKYFKMLSAENFTQSAKR